MANVEIYTKDWCPYSTRAKTDLADKGVSFEEIDVTNDRIREREMIDRSKRRTVPQIFVDGVHLGGSDDLRALEASGELDQLLSESARTAAA